MLVHIFPGVWSPKISFFDPGHANFDTALFKTWPIESKAVLQFRLETYNTFNHAEFNGVDSTAVYTNATTQDPVGNPRQASTYGQKNGTENPRYLQLALRMTF